MKFNSQIATSRVQSERLLSLGLKKETADMYYSYDIICAKPYYKVMEFMNGCVPEDIFPAWSLGRLWELYWSNKVVSDCLFGCGKYMNPYAKMIAMIEYDIEDGTFNKDYLDK